MSERAYNLRSEVVVGASRLHAAGAERKTKSQEQTKKVTKTAACLINATAVSAFLNPCSIALYTGNATIGYAVSSAI